LDSRRLPQATAEKIFHLKTERAAFVERPAVNLALRFPLGKIAQEKNEAQADFRRSLNLGYLRKNIQIETVGRLLGFEINAQHFATCFRPDNHRNGDAHPSLHFLERSNRVLCFACDRRAFSTIDFVIAVLESRGQPHDLPAALRWFQKEFGDLPTLKGRPAGITADRPFRVGTAGELEDFIRSGLFATLSPKAVRILFVITQLCDDKRRARLPYQTLMRFTGIRNRTSIKHALDELTAIHIIEIQKGRTVALEPENIYTFTPHNPALIQQMQDTAKQTRAAIAAETEYYREQKKARRRKPKPDHECNAA
jgi:hypothetical protein